MIEILIALGIAGFSVYTIYSRFKKKASGGCGCGNCSEDKGELIR